MTPSQPTSTDSSLQNLIRRAQEDLASRLALPADEVSFVEITAVEWSDSSLDCPQPGMSYMQVITPGYRIIFEVNGQPYEYHSNGDSNFVYCNNSSLPAIPKP